MNQILHVNASPRGDRSRSLAIGQHLLLRLQSLRPAAHVETLNLFDADLPAFDQAAVEGRYGLLMGQPVPAEQEKAWARLRTLTEHLLSFDTWLFTVPMWNFGLPYRLKHYIDLVTHPGLTFRNDAAGNVEGLATGRTAIIVAASAMPFGSSPDLEPLDFQLSYMRAWLGFIGVTDVQAVRVAGTFGPDDLVEAAMAKAQGEGLALADQLAVRTARV